MPMAAPTPALPQSTSKKEEPLKIPPPQLQPLTIKTTLAETRKKEREIKRKIDEVEKPIVNLPNPKRRRPSPVHSPPRESPESFIDVESQPSPLPPPAQGGLGAGKRPTVRDELPPAAQEPQDSMSLSPLPIRIPKQPPVRPTNATSSKPPKVTLIVNKKNNYDSDHEPPKKTIKIVIPIKLMDKAPPPKTNTAMEVEKKHIREERNTNTNTNTTATNPKSTNTTANTISISSNTKTNNTSNTNNTNIIKNTNTNTSTSNTNNTNNTKIPNSNATINTTLIPKNSNNGVTAGKGASVPNQDTNVANLMRLSDIPFGIKLDHITDSPSPPPQTPKTLEEFQNLKADFDRKHAFYMEIYAQLKLNEDHFRQLSDAWKVIKKTDDRKKIELQINHLYTQRSESVSKMKRKCDTLTEELTRISHHLQNFLNAIPVR
uniref:OCEL domain-containing protein n=1 Tax=Arcella intermedia TaxID=1963864 RepID=A0A6B2L2V7_9EUKA